MRIAVLGTGAVGQALARKLDELGHEMAVGTRDPEATLARTEPDQLENPPFKAWKEAHPGIALRTPPEAAAEAELVVNASNGAGSIAMLESAGEGNLSGKVLVDVANPLDFSHGMPPSLFTVSTDSLGEKIQRRFPQAKVVKALNTMNCVVMVEPARCPASTTSSSAARTPTPSARSRSCSRASAGPPGGSSTSAASGRLGGPRCTSPSGFASGALGTGYFNVAVVRAEG